MKRTTLKKTTLAGLVVGAMAAGAGELGAQTGWEWTEELPGGDTGCAFDTPYRFFHTALAEAEQLLIYFQGGGACWEFVSCAGMFDTTVDAAELSEYRGVFDPNNEANPFRDFAVLFIPYCTGDVHVGDTGARYGDGSSPAAVQHRGFRNAKAALDFASRISRSPRSIVVAGASAGSYGAVFHAPDVARRFPDATISVLGDSGVPLLNNYPDVLVGWGADSVLGRLRGGSRVAGEQLSLVEAHVAAHANGQVGVAQITTDLDAIQGAFYLISGSHEGRERTYALLDSIADKVGPFRSYVAAGSDHGLLRTDQFYEYSNDGVRLSDWVRDFIAGRAVSNVRCPGCRIR